MKKAIVFALALLVTGTWAIADNSRTGGGGWGPFGDGTANLREESDVLIYQCRFANESWGDMIAFYEAALTAAGATCTSIDAPEEGMAFPDDYEPCNYPVTFVLTGENFYAAFLPEDEATVQAYLEAGGNLYLSGQDYLYGSGYPNGAQDPNSFPYFIGLEACTQDTPFGADFMDVVGHDMFAGWYLFLDSFQCFLSNPFYPDTTVPVAGANDLWEQVSPETHMGALIYDAGAYRTIFSTLELAGDVLGEFPAVVAISWEWLNENSPIATETTTVGSVKASYK
jgi:hypothetical protein